MTLEQQIEEAILSTLVVENKESIKRFCVPKIIQILVDRGYITNDPRVVQTESSGSFVPNDIPVDILIKTLNQMKTDL